MIQLYPISYACRFQGKRATQQARQTYLNGYEMKDAMLAESSDPYLGALPQSFLKDIGLRNRAGRKFVNKLATDLRRYQGTFRDSAWKYGAHLRFRLGMFLSGKYSAAERAIPIKYLGSGSFGSTFQLGSRQSGLKLKVFDEYPYEMDIHGAYAEAAIGLYLTQRKVRDVAHLYMAKPSSRWLLMECIGKHTQLEGRQGSTLKELGFVCDDLSGDRNQINGIIYDLGKMFDFRR